MTEPTNIPETNTPETPDDVARDEARARQRGLATTVHRAFVDAAAGEVAYLVEQRDEAETAEERATYSRVLADIALRVTEAALLTTAQIAAPRRQAPAQAAPEPRMGPPAVPGGAPNMAEVSSMLRERFKVQQGAPEQPSADRGTMAPSKGGDHE
jgi:hypothetical protein